MGRLPERESDVLQTVRQGLELLGYEVLRVGQWRADRGGQDAGCPDLLVSRDTWKPGVWLGLECKGTRTRLSAEQRRLHAAGRIHIVRNWEQARAVVEEFEGDL
jgi:hypothetical protein